jgi:hypothetical protein
MQKTTCSDIVAEDASLASVERASVVLLWVVTLQ